VGWKARGETVGFKKMFAFDPRPIQSRIISLYEELDPQSHSWGDRSANRIGKTEIAYYWQIAGFKKPAAAVLHRHAYSGNQQPDL